MIHSVSWISVLLLAMLSLVASQDYQRSQCGGEGYYGDGKCPSGYTCEKINDGKLSGISLISMRVYIEFNEAYEDYCVQTASDPVRDTPSDDRINTAVPNVPTGPVAPVPPVDPGKGGMNTADPGIPTGPPVPTKPGNGNTNNTDPTKPTVPGGSSGNGAFTAITGAPGVEYRWPVQDLASKYPDVFNMFILALEALQKMPETLELSYYQLAGIHGAPFQAWQYPQAQRVDWGYCTHKSVIFVNWHRPYLLLVEQLLVEHAVRLANEFTGSDGDKYREAAKKVRLP
jgi:hypothetical protein